MKIIEPGLEVTPPTWRLRCLRCKTLIEYTGDDLQDGYDERAWVRCPNCRNVIAHSLGRRVDPIGRAEADVVRDYYNK